MFHCLWLARPLADACGELLAYRELVRSTTAGQTLDGSTGEPERECFGKRAVLRRAHHHGPKRQFPICGNGISTFPAP
jgi:hypothetical protein